jgi:hypothetical protein
MNVTLIDSYHVGSDRRIAPRLFMNYCHNTPEIYCTSELELGGHLKICIYF